MSVERGSRRPGAVGSAALFGALAVTVELLLAGTASGAAPRAGVAMAGTSRPAASAARAPHHSGSLTVVGVSPTNGATRVPGTASISVRFSAPVARDSPLPRLDPAVPGSWTGKGTRTLTFRPSEPFVPLSQVTLAVPGGTGAVRAASGAHLGRTDTVNFVVADGSTLRLQQLLSLLDYSPLAWTPTTAPISSNDTAAQLAAMYSAPPGRFAWRSTGGWHAAGWPSSLLALWKPGAYNVFTRGLVMSFQADHGLDVSGVPSGGLWNDLLQAVATGVVNTGGYNYAIGDKVPPQTLTIWHDGNLALKSSANTGIPQSPTPSGTFPVYARYRNEIMHGTNPDGSHYADPVQYVAYFYDGDAVHFFPRADYGVPQSLGCIELPYAQAAAAWPYLAYGTLVTIVN